MDQRIAETRTSDGVRIAYATSGHGRPLVYVSGWLTHLELSWSLPSERAFYEALSDGRTLVRYDKPGCGLSDRGRFPDYGLEQELEALQAVVDTVGRRRVDLFGASVGAAVAAAWAAANAGRVDRLVLYGGWAHGAAVASPEIREHVMGLVREHWGLGSDLLADLFATEADTSMRTAFAHYQRQAASPATACTMLSLAYSLDVRGLLAGVEAPTLVLHRQHDRAAPVAEGSALAEAIPGARFTVVPGRSHLPYVGDFGPLIEATRDFLGLPQLPDPPTGRLTARQMEVAALVADGLTNREIGDRLGIVERSAEAHVERIRLKLGLRSRAQLAAWYATAEQPELG